MVHVAGPDGLRAHAEFATEEDTFVRVRVESADALGPLEFSVRDRDGRILTFGSASVDESIVEGFRSVSDGSGHVITDQQLQQRVRLSWAVSRISDRVGNFLTVTYSREGDGRVGAYDVAGGVLFARGIEQYPLRIEYTGFHATPVTTTSKTSNGDQAPQRRVEFVYEQMLGRDATDSYVSGLHLGLRHRLVRVEAYAPDAGPTAILTRSYRFRYAPDATGQWHELAGVSECGIESECLPETTFEWTQASPVVGGFRDVGVVANTNLCVARHQLIT